MEAIELEAAAEYLNVSPHVSCKQLISRDGEPWPSSDRNGLALWRGGHS